MLCKCTHFEVSSWFVLLSLVFMPCLLSKDFALHFQAAKLLNQMAKDMPGSTEFAVRSAVCQPSSGAVCASMVMFCLRRYTCGSNRGTAMPLKHISKHIFCESTLVKRSQWLSSLARAIWHQQACTQSACNLSSLEAALAYMHVELKLWCACI